MAWALFVMMGFCRPGAKLIIGLPERKWCRCVRCLGRAFRLYSARGGACVDGGDRPLRRIVLEICRREREREGLWCAHKHILFAACLFCLLSSPTDITNTHSDTHTRTLMTHILTQAHTHSVYSKLEIVYCLQVYVFVFVRACVLK